MDAWSVELVPNDAKAGTHFVEARRGEAVFRIPRPIWLEQATCSPGGPGDAAHEAWLTASVRLRPSDIVVTTYPKCGTTLTEQIVLLLLNGGRVEALDPLSKNAANLHQGAGKIWPEACLVPDEYPRGEYPPGRPPSEEMVALPLSRFNALPSPRLIKTHADLPRLLGRAANGTPGPARYVVVARNPLDACTSCYYHGWNPSSQGWPFEAYATAWLSGHGNGNFGSWFDFHLGWWQLAAAEAVEGGPSLLWITYEDLVSRPEAEVRRIAAFLGIDADDELIGRVVSGSSFDQMKAAAVTAEKRGGRANASGHLRVGGVGDWRNHFSASQAEAFRLAFHTRLAGSGMRFDIGDGESLAAPE